MNIEKLNDNELLTIKLEGRLDTNTAPALEAVINEELTDVKKLVFDLEGLEYISSAGLRVILLAHKKMAAVGEFEIQNVCSDVMEVLEITGFSNILNIK